MVRPPTTTALPVQAGPQHRMLILIAMTGTLSMVMLDQTIVTVALPTMMRELPLSPGGAHWVASAYLLAMAALVALGGRLGDWLGANTACRIGVLLFFIASCGCGLAPVGAAGEPVLLLCRVLQGAGAALMLPASQAVVTSTFPLSERGRAMAIYVGIGQIFLAVGPLLGGLLTQWVSWRAVFWLNVPVGLATLALLHIARTPAPDSTATAPQPGVAVLLVTGMALFVLGIQEGPNFGWSSPLTIGSILGGLVILFWLGWQQWRSSDPLIDVRQVAQPGIGGDLALLSLLQFALIGMVLYGTIYLQNVQGFAPLLAGAASLPLILGLATGAQLGGRLFDKGGVRLPALAGLTVAAVGTALWALALLGSDYLMQVPGMALAGLGAGLAQSPIGVDALSRAPADRRTQVSGLVQTARQLGGTLGIAAAGALVLSLEPAGAVSTTARMPIAAAFAMAGAVLALGVLVGWLLLSRVRLTAVAGDSAG